MAQDIFQSYNIIEEIVGGGMGMLYHVQEKTTHQDFAIKKLNPQALEDPIAKKSFLDEAIVMTRLEDHPHIVKLHKISADDHHFYLIMEYIPGEDLKKFLRKNKSLRFPHAAEIVLAVAKALDYMHRFPIIHRDIKPANILLNPQDPGIVKVTDFGIAKDLDKHLKNYTTAGYGSLPYISPEQVRNSEQAHQQSEDHEFVGPTSDLYSLGLVFFEMLTGSTPFHQMGNGEIYKRKSSGQPPITFPLPSSVPPAGQQIIQELLKWDPKDRIQTSHILVEKLEALISQPVSTKAFSDTAITTALHSDNSTSAHQDDPEEPKVDDAAIPAASQEDEPPLPNEKESFEAPGEIFPHTTIKWVGITVFTILVGAGMWYVWKYFLVVPSQPPLLSSIATIVESAEIESQNFMNERNSLKQFLEDIHTNLQTDKNTKIQPHVWNTENKRFQKWTSSLEMLLNQQQEKIDTLYEQTTGGLSQIDQTDTQDWAMQYRSKLEQLNTRLKKTQSAIKTQFEKDKQELFVAKQMVQAKLQKKSSAPEKTAQAQKQLATLQTSIADFKKLIAHTEQEISQDTSTFMKKISSNQLKGQSMLERWQAHRKEVNIKLKTVETKWEKLSKNLKTGFTSMAPTFSSHPEVSNQKKLKTSLTNLQKQHRILETTQRDFSWETNTQLSLQETEILGCYNEQLSTIIEKNQRAIVEKSMASLAEVAILSPQVTTKFHEIFSQWSFVDVSANVESAKKDQPATVAFGLKEAGAEHPQSEYFSVMIPQRQGMWCLAQW